MDEDRSWPWLLSNSSHGVELGSRPEPKEMRTVVVSISSVGGRFRNRKWDWETDTELETMRESGSYSFLS
jgi:hypothetical protein